MQRQGTDNSETKANHSQRYANGTSIQVGHRIKDERASLKREDLTGTCTSGNE